LVNAPNTQTRRLFGFSKKNICRDRQARFARANRAPLPRYPAASAKNGKSERKTAIQSPNLK
jgi:hypothetical protein